MCLHCWAPDGFTIVLNLTCYSSNHETVQFDPVDQVLVPKYSPNGKLLVCSFDDDSQIHSFNFGLRIWDVADLMAKYQIHIAARHEGWMGDK